MPGYDKNLDKQIFAKSVEMDRCKLNVEVYSYNEGQAKLQITRENKNATGQFSYAKLGRMTKEEVVAVLPLIEEAKNHL
jgi:hypothetical protein